MYGNVAILFNQNVNNVKIEVNRGIRSKNDSAPIWP